MRCIMLKMYKILKKNKNRATGMWGSYFVGVLIECLSNSPQEFLRTIFDFSKLSIFILWTGTIFVAIIWIFYIVLDKIRVRKKVEIQFKNIIEKHTYEVLNKAGVNAYSWGYNKTICLPKTTEGWLPKDVHIVSNRFNANPLTPYNFPESHPDLEGYNNVEYKEYKKSEKIRIIEQREDNQERFAVRRIEKAMKGNVLNIQLQKTDWSQLQFSWDYLRRINSNNQSVVQPHQNETIDNYFINAINYSGQGGTPSGDFLINSFCLHLILVSNTGKVILSRISSKKENDYPSTWAATLGEQINREDFWDDNKKEIYADFVTRWVARALKEELGIQDTLTYDNANHDKTSTLNESDLEEYVDMSSLRVLSVDFEGDIYNVALTCLVQLKVDLRNLQTIKNLSIDANENTSEFRECSEEDIRKILLDYPSNQSEYHPSTYLRLLMFHLYNCGQLSTVSAFVKDSKRINRKKLSHKVSKTN